MVSRPSSREVLRPNSLATRGRSGSVRFYGTRSGVMSSRYRAKIPVSPSSSHRLDWLTGGDPRAASCALCFSRLSAELHRLKGGRCRTEYRQFPAHLFHRAIRPRPPGHPERHFLRPARHPAREHRPHVRLARVPHRAWHTGLALRHPGRVRPPGDGPGTGDDHVRAVAAHRSVRRGYPADHGPLAACAEVRSCPINLSGMPTGFLLICRL